MMQVPFFFQYAKILIPNLFETQIAIMVCLLKESSWQEEPQHHNSLQLLCLFVDSKLWK